MPTEYKYRAFISYCHRDEQWAAWLHKSLETWRVPKRLVGKDSPHGVIPARFSPIFRDRDELATATSLGETLTRALEQSQFQIVICSMAAAKSRWVNEEILTFKRLGREDRIFCLLVDGEPGSSLVPGLGDLECFPQALLYVMGADGNLTGTRSEPIAADVRKNKDGRNDARLKLLAGMLGVGLDDLKQREAHRRRQRLTLLLTGTTTGMILASALAATAWIARNEAKRQEARAQAEAETARQTTRFMLDLFKVSDPSEALGNTITAREILDKGAARIRTELTDQPAIQATLMDTMGSVYTSLGLYGAAVPLMQESLEKRRMLLGPQHLDVAQSLNNLGDALTRTSNFTESERDLRQALAIRREQLGNYDPQVAVTLSSLAEVLSARGEYEQGLPLIQEALQIRRAVFGEKHPLVAQSIGLLGQNYGERGEFKQAEAYQRQALALQRVLHSGAHPALAEAINNLAWTLMNLDRPAEAEPLYRESLQMQRKLLGDAHPDLALALNNLGYARQMRGDFRGAEAAYQEALKMNRALLGERHPEIANMMGNLALVMYAQGRRNEAIELRRASLQMSRDLLGSDHPDVASGAASLAYWLIDADKLDEAEQLIKESLASRLKQFGPDNPAVASTLTVRANLHLARREFRQAVQDASEAERILAVTVGALHWQMSMANNVHGAALSGLGKYDEAEELLLGSLKGLEGAPIPRLADKGRQRLVTLYSSWGKTALVERYLHP